MKSRRANHRLVKINYSYTIGDAANLLDKHKNTIREWIKQGLPVIKEKRPLLILGRELAVFLRNRKRTKQRTCGIDELYCFRCRKPQKASLDLVELELVTDKVGNLKSICPVCTSMMNKRVSLGKLPEIEKNLGVRFSLAQEHIVDMSKPSLNCDLRGTT